MSENPKGLTQSSEFLSRAFRMAVIPGMVSYLSSNLALLADGVLVGQKLAVNGLASVNLSSPLILVVSLAAGFAACGAETLCSRAVGQNNKKQAQRLYGTQYSLILIFSMLFIAAGLFFMDPIAGMLCGGDAVLFPMVRDYSRIFLLGAPAIMLTLPPFWFLPLEGKNKSMTAMTLIMGIGNICLDLLFLLVLDMGVTGAALASVISAGAAALFGMARLHTGRHTFSLRLSLPKGREWGRLAAAGSTEAFTNLFMALRVLTVNNILLRWDKTNVMVAQYAVVSAMAAIADAVTQGVPQSGTAILGVYCGERDNASTLLILKQQLKSGLIGCAVLMLILGAGYPLIGAAYQVEGLMMPLWMLAASLIPVLLVNILTSFYRVYGKELLADFLIAMRMYGFCLLSLVVLQAAGASPWLFQVAEAVLTLLLWALLSTLIWLHEKKKNPVSRWLLMNRRLEDGGNSINFTSPADPAAICDASERIGTFCGANNMAPRQTNRVSLALEEMMALIVQFNPEDSRKLHFDVRVFAIQGVIGVRIRYAGRPFNPLDERYREDERFMGIQMVRNLVEETVYQCTFGMNSLLILIK